MVIYVGLFQARNFFATFAKMHTERGRRERYKLSLLNTLLSKKAIGPFQGRYCVCLLHRSDFSNPPPLTQGGKKNGVKEKRVHYLYVERN
jgi:hypothetical protein